METDIPTLSGQVAAIHTSLKSAVEKLGEEAKANQGAATEATGKLVKDLGDSLNAAKAELKEKQDELIAELKSTAVRMDEVEKKFNRGFGALSTEVDSATLAQIVVGHEFYKRFVEANEKRSQKIPVKSFFATRDGRALKATFALSSAGGSDIQTPLRVAPVAPQIRGLQIRDLMPVRPTENNTIEYLEETGFGVEGGTAAITSITRSSQTATVTTTAAHGLIDGDLVRVSGAAQAEYNIDAYVTVVSTTVFTMTVAGSPASGSGTMLFQKLNGTGAAATVAEGALKPESLLEFELKRANCEVIATFLPTTKQVLTDNPSMRAYIDDRLLYSIAYEEEAQILYGSGTGNNLQGIMTHPLAQQYAWSSGIVGDTRIDAFRRAMTRAHVREFAPTGGVVNPRDWEAIELAKGSDDHYLWVAVPGGNADTKMFQVPLVITNAMAEGDFLVGSFAIGAALWDREQATIEASTEHSDFFRRNMVGILAEERLALTVFRPASFVVGAFDSAPAAE